MCGSYSWGKTVFFSVGKKSSFKAYIFLKKSQEKPYIKITCLVVYIYLSERRVRRQLEEKGSNTQGENQFKARPSVFPVFLRYAFLSIAGFIMRDSLQVKIQGSEGILQCGLSFNPICGFSCASHMIHEAPQSSHIFLVLFSHILYTDRCLCMTLSCFNQEI